MKNIALCIVDMDAHYRKAFLGAVALGHPGYTVVSRDACGEDCRMDVEVCILSPGGAAAARGYCQSAFSPACGRYAGVSAILSEARAFAFDRSAGAGRPAGISGRPGAAAGPNACPAPFPAGALICVYGCAGGQGVSSAAIGIGREISRYRGARAMYLSIEDVEDPGLFPGGVHAMRAEELLYRYMRAIHVGEAPDMLEKLFGSAASRDEYGLFRLAADEGAGSLSSLAPAELYAFLGRAYAALGLTHIVLDFGTRLHGLSAFVSVLDEGEAAIIEAFPEHEGGAGKRRAAFSDVGGACAEAPVLAAAFPSCPEDIRKQDGHTDVGLANAFGLAVKEVCDRIMGDRL
ncbi:MAG: hypothetical protein FWG03_06505 [Clostridiales bacterium]|nr:hypothetical protein [Clostridiales bacterium]